VALIHKIIQLAFKRIAGRSQQVNDLVIPSAEACNSTALWRNLMPMKIVLAGSLLILTVASLSGAEPVDFKKDVKPLLELNCVACHNAAHAHENGELDLSTKAAALRGGDKGNDLVPGNPEKSLIVKYLALPADDKKLMPPKDKGGPLQPKEIETFRKWIAGGAEWPDNVQLTNVMKVDFVRDIRPILQNGGPLSDKSIAILKLWLDQGAVWPKDAKVGTEPEMALVTDLQRSIVANSKEATEAEMKKYSESIPGTVASFDVVPIPGGEFVMGSAEAEANRKPDEGPQHRVKVSPFWMGRCEVTWDEYELFMYPDQGGQAAAKTNSLNPASDRMADAVTHPSRPYVEMSFGMGKRGFPAISMTQHGANKYCEWLSGKTGHFYRLPTEAEWEYAARAGTTTAYFFGNDAGQLGDYAWTEQNSELKYQKVGKKKPNPWGLYDIYGNVAEWTLDQYDPDYYKQFNMAAAVADPWNKATRPYPHAVRGGSWNDEAALCRSAARRGSDRSWKMQDPQLPKSIWYLTDAQFLGFRIVRPLKTPSAEEMKSYWNSGVEKE
jgi:formylglycine-generating enzyme required for sulfatase activity